MLGHNVKICCKNLTLQFLGLVNLWPQSVGNKAKQQINFLETPVLMFALVFFSNFRLFFFFLFFFDKSWKKYIYFECFVKRPYHSNVFYHLWQLEFSLFFFSCKNLLSLNCLSLKDFLRWCYSLLTAINSFSSFLMHLWISCSMWRLS